MTELCPTWSVGFAAAHLTAQEEIMVSRLSMFIGAAALAGVISLGATGVWALTMQECSAKCCADGWHSQWEDLESIP